MVGVLSPTPTMPPNDTLLADCMLFVIVIYFIYFLCLMYPLCFSVLWEKNTGFAQWRLLIMSSRRRQRIRPIRGIYRGKCSSLQCRTYVQNLQNNNIIITKVFFFLFIETLFIITKQNFYCFLSWSVK